MKPSFTPGPWVGLPAIGAVRTEEGRPIASVYGRNGETEVNATGVAENIALIAAAPDLYEALARIANDGYDAATCEEIARAALAKVADHA